MNATDETLVGIGYRAPYRKALLDADAPPQITALEVVPGHFFDDPVRLAPLAQKYPFVFHEVACSLGTARDDDPVESAVLERIRELLDVARPLFFTEHLALTASPAGVDLGHLAPLWYTEEMLAVAIDRVRRWQDLLGLDVALETITAPFVIPEADMSEPEFCRRLVEATGCGLLLDVTNQAISGHNLGFDPFERIAEYPLEAVWQVHLAGILKQDDGVWIDSHSLPVDESSLALLANLKGHAPLRTIIVERDDHLPPLIDLAEEAGRADAVWRNPL